jgi:hypothetical protein
VSKNKRGFQAPTSGATGADPSPPQGGTQPPPSGSRAAARRSSSPVRVSPEPTSFLEKYRFPLLIGALVVAIGAIGFVFMQSATAAPYKCETLMTPGPVAPVPTPRPLLSAQSPAPGAAASAAPAPSASGTAAPSASPAGSPEAAGSPAPTATPVPQPTQQLGFVAQDLGRDHVSQNTSVTYAYCPPTSGDHFSAADAPLPRRFYGPDDTVQPGQWIHNLEHGYVVLLYRDEPDSATLAELERVMEAAQGTDFTVNQCRLPNKVIAVRFDDMTTPYGAVSWDRALLLDTFDAQQLQTFAEQWQESDVWPEPNVC